MIKQNSLLEDASFRLPDIVLEEPMAERMNDVKEMLLVRCTKDELYNYACALHSWLKRYGRVMLTDRSGNVVETNKMAGLTKTNNSKSTFAENLSIIVASDQNMLKYFDSLSEEMKELWRTLLIYIYVSEKEAKSILHSKDNIFTKQRSFYYSSGSYIWKKNEFNWFKIDSFLSDEKKSYYYRDYEGYICISPIIRTLFMPLLLPKAYDDSLGHNELPEGHIRTLNFEIDSQTNYQLFCGLLKHNDINIKKKGVGLAEIKRAQKKMSLKEFFPGDSNNYRTLLRAILYIQLNTINKTYFVKKDDLEYHQAMRMLINEISRIDFYIHSFLFPHISGLRLQMTNYSKCSNLCKCMLNCLQEEPNRWLNITDIYMKILVMESDLNSKKYTNLVYFPDNESSSVSMVNNYTDKIIAANSYSREFGLTGLHTFGFMLASLGLAEIAINDDKSCDISPFDSLEFIRLTPLGRYALSVTNEYDMPEIEHQIYFELDPERLIIRSLINPNPYSQLLSDTSVAISQNRFETSAMSFLASCHTKSDVEAKIKLFRQFISKDIPPLWEQFFKSLLEHCHPMKEDKEMLKRYILDANNHELIQLLTTDPALRKLIIRAEGYRILVKLENFKKFETQLKKHGYLL